MIKNTALYNLANYETLHDEWEKEVRACMDLCFSVLDIIPDMINAEFKKIAVGEATDYHISDMWDVE